jgi:hypothetical protein
MSNDIETDPPISHAIANGWAEFAATVLPAIDGTERGKANVAFHFGAMYVLQILKHVVARESAEAATVALGMLTRTRRIHEGSRGGGAIGANRSLCARLLGNCSNEQNFRSSSRTPISHVEIVSNGGGTSLRRSPSASRHADFITLCWSIAATTHTPPSSITRSPPELVTRPFAT